jgi:transposase
MLILSYSLTDSGVHESQEFPNIWDSIHDSVRPKRSLADGGYTSNDILQLVRDSKAIPFHGIRKDAVLHTKPETAYQKLVNFALHWVNRFKKIYGERNLIETAFWMMDASFGYRIRSRSDVGRKNEVQAKFCAHNIRMLAMLCYMHMG